jgi:hypothetical protein
MGSAVRPDRDPVLQLNTPIVASMFPEVKSVFSPGCARKPSP